MKRIIALLIIFLGAISTSPKVMGQCSLTVNITSLHSDNGKVIVYLYNSSDGFPQDHAKAYKMQAVSIHNGKCMAEFDNIPIGSYAIACYHDENGNGKLDTNFLGIPSEGVGASNNAKGFMGPPKYKDAMITINTNSSISISINY